MVDFNKESTIGTPAANIVKVLVLQARANVFDALEAYNKQMGAGIDAPQYVLKVRLGTWFLEHQAYIERSVKKEDKQKVDDYYHNLFFKEEDLEYKDLMEIIIFLNKVCDKIRLTKLDLKKHYEKTKVEEDNAAHGLF